MKQCTLCRITKVPDDFHVRKRASDGRQSRCKDCKRLMDSNHFQENRDEILKRNRAWKSKNYDKIAWYSHSNYIMNKELVLFRAKSWRKNNPEKIKVIKRVWGKITLTK